MQPHQGGQQRGESLVCRETYTKPLLLALPKENWSRAGVGMGTGRSPSSAWLHPAQALPARSPALLGHCQPVGMGTWGFRLLPCRKNALWQRKQSYSLDLALLWTGGWLGGHEHSKAGLGTQRAPRGIASHGSVKRIGKHTYLKLPCQVLLVAFFHLLEFGFQSPHLVFHLLHVL